VNGMCLGQSSGYITRQHRHCREPLQVLSHAWYRRPSNSTAKVERVDRSRCMFSFFHLLDVHSVAYK